MKVQLIVVQGKPEGKVIPLAGSLFKIGRGETCHLRPASDQVSREHAEFTVSGDTVSVRDLGSRNGTLVNGKVSKGAVVLKDRDLIQVGPLTFALSIQGAASTQPKGSPDDVSAGDIDSWLVADSKSAMPERPSGIYGGDTLTISAFKDASSPGPSKSTPAPTPAAKAPEPEEEEEGEEEFEEEEIDDDEDDSDDDEDSDDETSELPEEFVDESNPFYVKKKVPGEPTGTAKQVFKDTSDAANDILRKMMERRRNSR